LLGVTQHKVDLLARYSRKPLQKVLNPRRFRGFSNKARTGTRVPLNSQSPLTLPGMRSTAGHWLQ
jgi:acetolactate synthase regulatory subunit